MCVYSNINNKPRVGLQGKGPYTPVFHSPFTGMIECLDPVGHLYLLATSFDKEASTSFLFYIKITHRPLSFFGNPIFEDIPEMGRNCSHRLNFKSSCEVKHLLRS